MKKKTSQLEREIAAFLLKKSKPPRRQRHHATRQDNTADWDVAMDAILEHKLDRAAEVVASIREERNIPSYAAITMDAPATFVTALEGLPTDAQQRFYKTLKKLQAKKPRPKPGSPEFAEKTPGVMTLYVPPHGYFSADVLTYHRYKRMPRAKLLAKVLRVYEGTRDTGDKASHWRGYDKDALAMIVADAFGNDAF